VATAIRAIGAGTTVLTWSILGAEVIWDTHKRVRAFEGRDIGRRHPVLLALTVVTTVSVSALSIQRALVELTLINVSQASWVRLQPANRAVAVKAVRIRKSTGVNAVLLHFGCCAGSSSISCNADLNHGNISTVCSQAPVNIVTGPAGAGETVVAFATIIGEGCGGSVLGTSGFHVRAHSIKITLMSANTALVNIHACSANLFPPGITQAVVLTVVLEGTDGSILALSNTDSMSSTCITRKVACSVKIFAKGNVLIGDSIIQGGATSSLGTIVSDVTAVVISNWAHHYTFIDVCLAVCVGARKPRVRSRGNILALTRTNAIGERILSNINYSCLLLI
jgi:hypothetical protein